MGGSCHMRIAAFLAMAACVVGLAPAWASPGQSSAETVTLTGRAVSTDGKPVAGVKMTFQYARFGEQSRAWNATSDEKGEFRVEVNRDAARSVQISAEAPPGGKLAPTAICAPGATAALDSTEPASPITVLLAPATACIKGAVLGDGNEPVAGATVTIAAGDFNRSIVRTATTDGAGKFQIPALAPGMYTVRSVEPPAGTPWVRLSTWKPGGVRSVGLGDGVTREENFRLPRGARNRCDETVFRFRTVRDERYRYIRNFTPDRAFLQKNDYKERSYPVWNLLKELHAQGKLTPAQEALCAATMPEQELYDLQIDPHEINNLAKSPEHQEALKRLRAALERWIEETNDQGKTFEPPDVAQRKGQTRPVTEPASQPGADRKQRNRP